MSIWLFLVLFIGVFPCQAQEGTAYIKPTVPADEASIMAQTLDLECPGDLIIEIARHTCWPYMAFLVDPSETERIARIKEHIRCNLNRDMEEVDGLIDQLLEKNRESYHIPLSDPANRTYTFTKEEPQAEQPDESSETEDFTYPWQLQDPPKPAYDMYMGISRPAIDPDTGRILIYVVRSADGVAKGDVILFESNHGQLKQVTRGTILQ